MPAAKATTTCVLDCPDGCALEVEIEDGRVRSVGPDRSAGTEFICGKVAGFDRRLYHRDRILTPLRRRGAKGGGDFEPISWDAALDELSGRLGEARDRWGGESILPYHYGGSNGLLTDELIDDLLFARLGASRLAKTICAVPATEVALGMYGKMPGVAFEDYPRAQCIVIWGANPKGSNIHLVPQLREAKRRGAFIAAIDPRRNFGAPEIDLHLPVLPGQDLPLALAMINWWRREGALDERFLAASTTGAETLLKRAAGWPLARAAAVCGVEADAIRELAKRLAESSPAVVRCGWGLERNRNGGQAVAAVLAIPALLGKFGVRGGGYTLSNNGGSRFDPAAVIGSLDWRTRRLNMTQLARQLDPESGEPLEPPVKVLFVYNANPVATVPRQGVLERGLGRDDLYTVVHDQVMTDTARWADLVLPAATFLEGTDLKVSYGEYVAGGLRPVVAPAGEARTNMQLFGALGQRLGFGDAAFAWSDAEILERATAALELDGRRAATAVATGGRDRYDFGGATPIQFDSVRPRTVDGKVHLTPDALGPQPFAWQAPDDDYPLALVTPASSRLVTSMFGETSVDRLTMTIHPEDAHGRGLASGDRVRVFNAIGEVHCVARVDDSVRPGVVSMPKGAWRRSSLNGATSTALCPDDAQVVGDAACFNDARVEIEALRYRQRSPSSPWAAIPS